MMALGSVLMYYERAKKPEPERRQILELQTVVRDILKDFLPDVARQGRRRWESACPAAGSVGGERADSAGIAVFSNVRRRRPSAGTSFIVLFGSVSSDEVTESAGLTSVEDPSRVHLMQENMTSDTLHNCVPYCVNWKEEDASKDPNCPAKKQADAQTTLAAYKRPPHHPTPPSDKVPAANSRRENYRQPPIPRGSTQQHRSTRSLSRINKDTQGTHNLSQYTPYTQPSITQTDRRRNTYTPTLVTTYISEEHPSIQFNTTDTNTAHQEHVIITLQPRNCPNPITIVNAYWRPGRKVANPTPWLTKLVANNTDNDILLVGDFNSPYVSWGYPNTQHNGRLLEQASAQTSMTLANDTTQPTHTGNSVERDTNPDLAFHHSPSVSEWSASDEQLGSDHRLIHLTLITNVKQKTQLRKPTRLALGVPHTPHEHLQQMDPFNTLEERVDLHRLGQQQGLTTSLQGRYILNSLGYDTLHLPPIKTTTPPWDTIAQITTLPISQHMNPDSNPERRKHIAKLISQKLATLQA
ncbi:hypothetical protein HPB47_011983 [Ixodes persulcatus]|uniref:Uncharacterized protein n=1 Tax=Ixodes persulcatus TaxID=34615 RepID=A0AC60NUZ2_IXOPE|nr:hypothetical protein HPB47_011983 [Ixodes persulcatus]